MSSGMFRYAVYDVSYLLLRHGLEFFLLNKYFQLSFCYCYIILSTCFLFCVKFSLFTYRFGHLAPDLHSANRFSGYVVTDDNLFTLKYILRNLAILSFMDSIKRAQALG